MQLCKCVDILLIYNENILEIKPKFYMCADIISTNYSFKLLILQNLKTYRYLRRSPSHHFQNHQQIEMMIPNLTPIQCPVFARIALINVRSYVHGDATTLVLRPLRHQCVLSAFQVILPNLDVCFEHA